MKKIRLMNLEKTVREVLEESELSRQDDCYLIFEVIRRRFPYEAR